MMLKARIPAPRSFSPFADDLTLVIRMVVLVGSLAISSTWISFFVATSRARSSAERSISNLVGPEARRLREQMAL